MKRFLCSMLIAVMVLVTLTGCITFKDANYVEKGRALGTLVALTYPEVTKEALPYAQGLLTLAKDGKIDSAQIMKAVSYLEQRCPSKDVKFAIAAAIIFLPEAQVEVGKVDAKVVSVLTGAVEGLSLR